MTHRDRVLAAIRRQPPDRLPIDLGGTIATTLTAGAQDRLRVHMGIASTDPPVFFARRSGTVIPDELILRRFDVDARPLLLGAADAGPERPVSANAFVDEWGVTWTRPEGGHYISTDGPFYRLDEPSSEHLERYPWPDPADPGRYRGLRDRARALHETGCAVILNLGVGPVHQCQFLRGFGEWLGDLLANTAFAETLLDRVTNFWIDTAHGALAEAGEYVDLAKLGFLLGVAGRGNPARHSPSPPVWLKDTRFGSRDAREHGYALFYERPGSSTEPRAHRRRKAERRLQRGEPLVPELRGGAVLQALADCESDLGQGAVVTSTGRTSRAPEY